MAPWRGRWYNVGMKSTTALAAAAALSSVSAVAGNPLVKGVFTPDPAPFVHGDKVYMFTGHDENDAKFFKMKEWFVFESEDLVNWKSLGARQRQSRRRICITRTGVYPLNTCYFTPSRAGWIKGMVPSGLRL
jgi:hypothetical protein